MAGKTPPAPVVRTLAAGESVRIDAALKTLFGLADDAAGTITVSSDAALLASLTTRNVAAPEGPYGLGLVRDADMVEVLAEIGIIFLLFTPLSYLLQSAVPRSAHKRLRALRS